MQALSRLLLIAVLGVQTPPGVGATIADREIRVTLLTASRIDETEYRREMGTASADWAGGGFHFIFQVENRPGAQIPPVLGDIRVFIGGRQYNPVSNAASSKPFAPLAIMRDSSSAVARDPRLRDRIVQPRPGAVAGVLEFYVPGNAVPADATGEVSLEQCETHRRSPDGHVVQLTGMEMRTACADFRFAFSIRQ